MTQRNPATVQALIGLVGVAAALPGCTLVSDTRTARILDRVFWDDDCRRVEYEGRPIGDPGRPASSGGEGAFWPRK